MYSTMSSTLVSGLVSQLAILNGKCGVYRGSGMKQNLFFVIINIKL